MTVDGLPVGYDRSGQKLEISLGRTLAGGADFKIAVDYGGTPHVITGADGSSDGWTALTRDRGAFVAGEPQGAMTWFPCNDHPSDKSTYDITVTVPQGYTVSNGVLRTQHTVGGLSTFSWHETAPMAAYLATASVGRFDVRQYWTPGGMPVYTAVDPAQKADADDVLDQLPAVSNWGAEHLRSVPVRRRRGDRDT